MLLKFTSRLAARLAGRGAATELPDLLTLKKTWTRFLVALAFLGRTQAVAAQAVTVAILANAARYFVRGILSALVSGKLGTWREVARRSGAQVIRFVAED